MKVVAVIDKLKIDVIAELKDCCGQAKDNVVIQIQK